MLIHAKVPLKNLLLSKVIASCKRWSSTTSSSNIRNIGIIAHVDAGKTTTTERMLFYSGVIEHLGNVDDGNTVTDYMDQERERGITITAAAISLPWHKHTINLVDTPGHVDFTFEVERSLRVLDGAVTILDASAGVEAQTLTVWRQSAKYRTPRLIYVNKMDKKGASFADTLRSIEKRLQGAPHAVTVHMPLGVEKNFRGFVDLVNMRQLTWSWDKDASRFGKSFQVTPLSGEDDTYVRALEARVKMLERLASLDDEFAERLLDTCDMRYERFTDNMLLDTCLRRATLECKVAPVLCGSSFRNIGVQPLMDAIVK